MLNLAQSIFSALLLLGLFWTFSKIAVHLQEIIFFPVVNTVIRDLTHKVVQHIHHVSLLDYQQLSIPEIMNCIRRISLSARAFIKIICLMIIPTICKLIIATMVMLKLGLFGLWLVLALLLSCVVLYYGTLRYAAIRDTAWQFSDTVISRLSDSILNTKIVRPFLSTELNHLGEMLQTEATLWQTVNTRLHTIYVVIGLILGSAVTTLLVYAALDIQDQLLSVGDFVLIQGQLIAVFLPLKTFALESRQVAESLVDIKKIVALFDIPIENNRPSPIVSSQTKPPLLQLDNISFGFDIQNPMFHHTSFTITAGSKIGIMGTSGSGKSSLIHLMAGLYQPNRGEVRLNGQIIHTIPKDILNQWLYCIPQDFRLFNTSLRNNLCYGMPLVSDVVLLQIAAQTKLLDLIQQAPFGLDTLVGEMGIKLSGGEKQKIALARALLLNPTILLLDETTNALNTEVEQAILKTIFAAIPTVVLVSHRASALAAVDEIYTLCNGILSKTFSPQGIHAKHD
jgi:ABC-type multidrug transport system fused ATPase/permease subunit